MRPQVKNWQRVATATQPPQATAVRAALRPVAMERLRPAAKHCPALARHSPGRDFHQN
jgi:hypothetical protein